jgi:hypothetical protein
MRSVAWFVAGGLAWSASEYAIHRFIGHGPKRKRKESLLGLLTPAGIAAEFNAEHLAHHTNPSYFAATSRKVAAAAAGIPMVMAAVAPFVGVRRAGALALGFSAAYGMYEVLHRRIHTHPPTGAYSRWVRRHHLYHHHKTPRANHGVTSPIFDHVFRTVKPVEKIRVPRHVAAVWLVDPSTGEVRDEFREDYELAGRREARAAEPQAAATL